MPIILALLFCAGCSTPTARQVAALPDYHATQDYRMMEQAFDSLDRIARKNLSLGMSPSAALRVMGEPKLIQSEERGRVHIWSYLVSISGTWTYSLAFLDGRLEYFGRWNPQWLDMESSARASHTEANNAPRAPPKSAEDGTLAKHKMEAPGSTAVSGGGLNLPRVPARADRADNRAKDQVALCLSVRYCLPFDIADVRPT